MSEARGSFTTLQALLKACALPAWIVDPKGWTLDVNAAFCALTGLEASQLIGRYSIRLDRTVEAQGLTFTVAEVLDGGQGRRFTYHYDSCAQGLTLEPRVQATLEILATPINDARGVCEYALLQTLDVTEERHALEILHQTQERFELILQGTQDGLWDWDLRTNKVRYSPRWKAMLGYEPHELEDHLDTWSALIHPEDGEASWGMFHEYMRGERARFQIEFRMRHKAGHWVPILSRAFKRVEEGGAPISLVGTHVDLTRIKAAEAAARRQAELSQRVIEHMEEGVCLATIIDGPQRVRFSIWNQRILEITGYTRAEINARGWFELLHPDPLQRARALARLEADQRGHSLDREPWAMTRADGEERVVSVSTNTLPSGEVLMVLRDLTQQRAEEAEREAWDRRVQESQRLESLGVLAGGVAHDFNNILMVVSGNVQMARMDLSHPREAEGLLLEAERALRRAADLTQQMLAYSGRGQFVIKPVDLSALVSELGGLLISAIPKRVRISVALDHGLPLIKADVAQLQQLVMNLIINSAESYEGRSPGVVAVRTSKRRCDQATLDATRPLPGRLLPPAPGDYVVLEVEDQGCGMTSEVRARIFEPFFSTKFTGRGLGMSAVLGILRGHDGVVELKSHPGGGTHWRVMFPVGDALSPAHEHAAESSDAPAEGFVLVVDDEPGVRALVARMLSRLGYSSMLARSGEEALRLYAEYPTDCLLLDLSMPGMSGLDTLMALRAQDPNARVILASGYDERALLEREGLSAVGFLKKPFELNTLAEALKEVMGEGEREA